MLDEAIDQSDNTATVARFRRGVGGWRLDSPGAKAAREAMSEILETPAVQMVLALGGLAAALAVGAYAIGKIRSRYMEEAQATSEMLSEFREIHSQGGLSDEEFRTIKSMLSGRLSQEVKRTSGDG